MSHHDHALWHGWDCDQRWQDPWVAPALIPSTSPDHGFKSDRSSVSTSSSVSLCSSRFVGFRHMHHGWHCTEPGGHMKINLLVFEDEKMKRCHHLSKFTLGYNGVSLSWVPRLHPPPLCYLLPTGLSRGGGKKLKDRCHFRWCAHLTWWAL